MKSPYISIRTPQIYIIGPILCKIVRYPQYDRINNLFFFCIAVCIIIKSLFLVIAVETIIALYFFTKLLVVLIVNFVFHDKLFFLDMFLERVTDLSKDYTNLMYQKKKIMSNVHFFLESGEYIYKKSPAFRNDSMFFIPVNYVM